MALPKGLSAVLAKAPSDTVILSTLRTPICRSRSGQLKDTYPEELLSVVLRATLEANPRLPPDRIEDVAVGVVLSELGGSKAARAALNHVGFSSSATTLHTVNRACASSLQSIAAIAAQIRVGMTSVGIAAGMESMTRNYGSRAIPTDLWPALRDSTIPDATRCFMPMGLTSENVARRYGVTRTDQDAFAVESHRRAADAHMHGRFNAEIVPVRARFQPVDKLGNKSGDEREVVATRDDGIRVNATLEVFAKLKPVFLPDGASTAGNSSQVSDGAAATLLMRRSTAVELGLGSSIMGKFVGATVAGCAPDEMGVGPVLAIPRLLSRFGLENADVDRWEINEAFASQAVYCVRELGLTQAWEQGKVNPDGGAIALGHPLGATGARMTATLMHGLRRSQNDKVGVGNYAVRLRAQASNKRSSKCTVPYSTIVDPSGLYFWNVHGEGHHNPPPKTSLPISMMLILLLSASLVWVAVLTFFVVTDYRLLLKVIRWSATIYLIGLGLIIPEILRVGLIVNGQEGLHGNAVLAWAAWFSLTVLAIVDWRFLVPASAVPMWFLSSAEARVLLNYGLVRLGWLDAFYSPIWWWMMTRQGVPDLWSKADPLRGRLLSSVIEPILASGTGAVQSFSGLVFAAGEGLKKLVTGGGGTWFPPVMSQRA
ncbi:hypothetical protein SLS62_002388 [Diatrype stigma]|uniref:Uncharacterized protein n=1 Tax=Diatrype stigma TaxID=117547 RepID=A0AAN9V6I6_9PEZI